MKLRQPAKILTCRITTLLERLWKIFHNRIKAERIDYGRRLERIEAAKAKERQATSTGGSYPQLRQNSDEAGRTDDVVAERLGIGSRDTYRKEKYIADNRDQLALEDFADWDEGRLSTNKAYQRIKARLQEAEPL